MVEMYYKLVLAGKRTCNELNLSVPQVPSNLKNEVSELLKVRGYDNDGNKISSDIWNDFCAFNVY